MAYPIKNTATLQRNSLQKTNFAVGVNQGGYGLTSSTAFWNGKTPNINQYVVYVGNGTSSPTMYVVATDSELITLSNTLGIGTNYNITMALNAFMAATNMICFNMDTPNIVTSGLTLNLDAGFVLSYPRAYTTWTDLSGSGNTGTLVNGPTFDSTNYGSISFDGSDDYVDCGNNTNVQSLTQITMSVWVKFFGLDYSFGTGELIGFMSKGYPDLSSPNNGFWFSYDNRSNGSSFSYTCFGNSAGGFAGGGNNFGSKSYTFTNNVWYNITATVNSSSQGTLYINGVQQGSSVTFNNLSIPNTANTLYVGRIDVPGYSIYGNIIQSLLYNRALSSAEVLQNYYAGLKRLIPTDNVVIWLDGENTNTRVSTPTTAYDVSGNNYNGSLINGTSLSHRDGGTSFYFDGSDDYINCGNVMPSGNYTKVFIFKVPNFSYSDNLVSGGADGSHYVYLAGSPYLRTGHFNGGEAISSYVTTVNTWNFAVVTFSTTSGFVIYQNGNTVVGSDPSTGAFTGGNKLNLGTYGGSFLLQGNIGVAIVYSRLLTTTEILTVYNAYKGRFGYA